MVTNCSHIFTFFTARANVVVTVNQSSNESVNCKKTSHVKQTYQKHKNKQLNL